ncbi:MAG: hypothetical protein V3T31_07385, partial [candidate division Zixibacteria bacterium]
FGLDLSDMTLDQAGKWMTDETTLSAVRIDDSEISVAVVTLAAHDSRVRSKSNSSLKTDDIKAETWNRKSRKLQIITE